MIELLPIFAIPANRLRGQEGFAGLGRFYMAALPALPLTVHSIYVAILVLAVSFVGVSVSHRAYFELTTNGMWIGMAKTGVAYVYPASFMLTYYDHYIPAVLLLMSGAAKPVAYYIAKRLQPNRDFLALAEYIFGAVMALGLLPSYVYVLTP